MNPRRVISLTVLAVCTVSGVMWAGFGSGDPGEHRRIRDRYQAMREATHSGSVPRASLFLLPSARTQARDEIDRLRIFALDLDDSSTIATKDGKAWICPRRKLGFVPFLQIGDALEMIRYEGEWYFSGRVSVW